MIRAQFPFRRVAAATLAVGLLAGCSSAGHPAAAPAPATAWDRTLNRIGPDGKVDTATALAAFRLAIGPVPGVQEPSGPARTIPSGTLAVQWVLGHWRQLTAGQQHAVLADLGVTTTAAFERKPALQPEIPCLTADSAGAGAYRAQVAGIESDIAGHVGDGGFSPEVYIGVNNVQLAGADAGMYTVGCTTGPTPGRVDGCTIHVNPLVSQGHFAAGDVRDFLIHEMLHCYLDLKLGAGYLALPAWYVEGVPSWGMNVLGSGSNTESSYWREYLDTPDRPVFARSYDALGFFTHLAETGTDVWHRIVPAGTAMAGGSSAAGWRAFAPGTAFLDSWGSGYAQGRYPGAAWRTGGPNLPSYQGPIPQDEVGNGQSLTVKAPAAATAISHVDLDAQVVLVTGTGNGRFSLDGDADATLAEAAGTAYSTGGSGTACPAGSNGAGATLTPIASGAHYLAVTGGLSAGQVSVQGLSLATFCARPARSCLVGTWTATVFQAATSVLSEHGGAGVVLRITATGAMSVDFGPMQPVELSGSFHGRLIFDGKISGQIVLPPASTRPGTAYAWRPAAGSTADYRGLVATVHVTSPIDYTFGPVSVADLGRQLGAQGSGVDTQPLSAGTETCTGDTLVIRAPAGVPSDGNWSFGRTA